MSRVTQILQAARNPSIVSLEWASMALGAALLGVTVWDVCGRYLFGTPLFGASEMIQYLMGAFVFCGLGLVSARDAHVAVDIFSPRLSETFPRVSCGLVTVFTVAGLCIIAWQLARSGMDAIWRGQSSLVLELPVAGVLLLYAALCALAAILQAIPEDPA